MGNGFGIAALIVLFLSLGVPVIGNFITLLALLLAVVSALGRSKVWPIAIAAAGGIKLFFLSPTWMAAIYQDLTWMMVTLAFIAAPIVAMLVRGSQGDAAEQALFSFTAPSISPTPAPRQHAGDDIADWDRLANKDDPDQLQEYLLRHPTGRFAELARMKLERLGIQPLQPPIAPATDEAAPALVGQPQFAAVDTPPIIADRPALQRESFIAADYEPQSSGQPRVAGFLVIGLLIVGALGAGGFYWWDQNQQARAAEAAWNAVPRQDAYSLRQYLAGDAGTYRDDAEAALVQLEADRYAAARATDTIEALNAFVADFPESSNLLAARGRIAELQMAAAEAAAEAAALEFANAAASFTGAWRGTMQQNGRGYDLIAVFEQDRDNRVIAAIEYVELRCSGRWEGDPGSATATGPRRVRESISTGRNNCVNEGIIELTPQSDGGISVSFYHLSGRSGGMTGVIYPRTP